MAAGKICKQCHKTYPSDQDNCPDDGEPLAPVMTDPLLGTLFADKYEIQSILGRGGMSIVYKARHKYMNRTVAVKLLLEQHMEDPIAFKRFQQESEAASSLSHQNIVIVHDFGITQANQAYFVMDCLEGDSLEDVILRDGPVAMDRAINIFRQVCDGLIHAHKKGVVHRDIKPSNVVLIREDDGSETVKIVDFGLAKLHRPQGPDEARLTQSGMVFGSPLYMSPEQCQGYPLDGRSDVYSVGILMYETLAGVTPFAADSFFNLALLHLHQKPPAFAQSAPHVSVSMQMEAVIAKCLEKDPADRFETVEQLRQKLLDVALISGVPGLKAGAVPVSKTGSQAAFRQTWDNIKAVIDNTASDQKKQKLSMVRIGFVASTLSILIIGAAFMALWPGIEGDRGTPWDKMRWQLDVAFAQQAAQSADYDKAIALLGDAKTLASGFGDKQSRLRMTLEQQAEVYRKAARFPEAEQATNDAASVLTHQIQLEAEAVKSDIAELGRPTASESKKATNKLAAVASANRVMLSSRRLYSRGLYQQEEALLKQALSTFERLQLKQSDPVANFETAMADTLIAQQRLDEVRTFLVDALNIRQTNATDGTPGALRERIKAGLKLGQFDRDQSDFGRSEPELAEALKLAEKHFPQDRALMAECLNSYADQKRQTGKAAEYEALLRRSKSFAAAPR